MNRLRLILLTALAAVAVTSAFGQAWTSAYEAGLKAAKASKWTEARTDFLKAAAYRPEDASAPTMLPGPVTERRTWRNGAPYSPNFLAAYSAYKAAAGAGAGDDQSGLLKTAAGELEERLAKGQSSRATYYILTAVYEKLGDVTKRDATLRAFSASGEKLAWKVDTDGISPEDFGLINSNGTGTRPSQGTTVPSVRPDKSGNVPLTNPSLSSAVISVPTKFALLIGNSESKLPGGGVAYAGDDAQLLREALIAHGGYLNANVDVVVNATAAQILTSAKALADRMPNNATVLIFYAGRGVNIGGKDFLAGVDTSTPDDTASMAPKAAILDFFLRKSAAIFSFYELSRPVNGGRYFGTELPAGGDVSQMFATSQGNDIGPLYRDGKQVGTFIDAFVDVMKDLHSNAIPILEFGWQVFYKMRHGSGSQQTPTLPILSHMEPTSRF